MPAKKAPSEAPKAADSPKNAKAEKPAAGGGGEKPQPAAHKDNQARGGQHRERGPNQQVRDHDKQGAGSPAAREMSSDPGVAAVQKKLNDIDAKIEKHKDELVKIKEALDREEEAKKALVQKSQDIGKELDEFDKSRNDGHSNRGKIIEALQERRRLVGLKRDEAAKIKVKLPTPPPKNMDSQQEQEAYLNQLQEDIRRIERSMAEGTSSLQAEKKKVEEISELRKAIKTFKEYSAIHDKIREDNKYIQDVSAELDKGKEARDSVQSERQVFRNRRDEVSAQIEVIKQKKFDLTTKRAEIQAARDALMLEKRAENDKLKEAKDKMYEKQQQERAKRMEERKRRDAERAEQQAAWNEKRRQEQEEREKTEIPYEGEIDLCDLLIKYIQAMKPKEKEEVAPAPVKPLLEGEDVSILKKDDGDDVVPKKKYQKKQKTKVSQDLKHNLDVYKQFESVSLAPPTKLSDIDASLDELKAKKEHYKKLQGDAVAAKKEKAAAAEAAKKEAVANNANNNNNNSNSSTTNEKAEEKSEEPAAEVAAEEQ